MRVIVVGAGICGASVANELHHRGIDVLLLDRGEVSMETTGLGEGNVLVCDKPPGPERELAAAGRVVWRDLAERFPDEVKLRAKGALVLYGNEDAASAHAATLAEAEVVPNAKVIEPALAEGVWGVLVPGDLQVDPRATARALAAEVPVRTHAKVVGVTDDGVTLVTGERLPADVVVLAAGPWTGPLALRAGARIPVSPRKGQLVALGPAPGLIRHKCVEGAYLDLDDGISSVVEEAITGEVYVGSSRAWAQFDEEISPVISDALVERATRWFPGLGALPRTSAWVGFRPALAGGPAIGRIRENLFVTTGHEGAGVGLGPISGRLLAQLIAGEQPAIDLSPFDPLRFQRSASRAS